MLMNEGRCLRLCLFLSLTLSLAPYVCLCVCMWMCRDVMVCVCAWSSIVSLPLGVAGPSVRTAAADELSLSQLDVRLFLLDVPQPARSLLRPLHRG